MPTATRVSTNPRAGLKTTRARTSAPTRPVPAKVPKAAIDAEDGMSKKDVPLTQQAYESIKGRILSMELRPGLFVNEAALCELIGIGRMPVHQAIHRLQAEGMVEVIPRKGLVIRMDSVQDIVLLLEARLAMEPNIVALAAERISDTQITELERLIKSAKKLLNQTQRESFSMIDREFHRVVAEASGNKFLADSLLPLHERSDLMWHLRIMPSDGLEVTQREHEAIYKAVVQRDAVAAHRAMKAHLTSLHDRILKAFNR